jgi:hypothetical protein
MFLIGGISKTKNNMNDIRILRDHETLDASVEEFRIKSINLGVKNTSTAGIFLITAEKFEKVWDTIIEKDESDPLLEELKETWISLIKQKKVILIQETNIKNLIDIL